MHKAEKTQTNPNDKYDDAWKGIEQELLKERQDFFANEVDLEQERQLALERERELALERERQSVLDMSRWDAILEDAAANYEKTKALNTSKYEARINEEIAKREGAKQQTLDMEKWDAILNDAAAKREAATQQELAKQTLDTTKYESVIDQKIAEKALDTSKYESVIAQKIAEKFALEKEELELDKRDLALEEHKANSEALDREEQELLERERAFERRKAALQTAQDREELELEKRELAAAEREAKLEAEMRNRPNLTDYNIKLNEQNPDRLVAINVDWTHDMHEIAHDLAERELNAEVAKGKLIKRFWKGTLFKKYYKKKYEKEYLSGDRKDADGKTVDDYLAEQNSTAIERFTLGAVEDMRYIHTKIGKKNEDGTYDDGEKLVPADEKTNAEIKSAIEDYARRRVGLGEKLSDLNRDFKDNIARVLQEAIDEGRMSEDSKHTHNYLEVAKEAARRYEEVAINARSEAEHEAAMAKVMAGFQVYNADVRSSVRTDAHRDALDRIVNKLESSKIGQFVPAEIIAGAVGATAGLTQTGARAIAGAMGGIFAGGVVAGLKERNRVTEDRVRMMRDVANGYDYGNDQKTAKYEKKIGGTLYDMRRASALTADIEESLQKLKSGEGDLKHVLWTVAEARVRVDFSDSEQKDLISYSSADRRGDERLALDTVLIKTENIMRKTLSKEDQELFKNMKNAVEKEVIEGYEDEAGEYHDGVLDKDSDFKHFRTIAAMKKAGKSLALGGAFYFASQEIMSLIDPGKIGILEKAGIVNTKNNTAAKETLLASHFGARGTYEATLQPEQDLHRDISDPNELARYEANGYQKVETSAAWSEPKDVIRDVDPSASTSRVNVKYDGWANNGTRMSDGNELLAHIENGKFVSTMRGASTMGGQTINYDPANVKAFLTIGDSKFEIAGSFNEAGQLTWGENGIFTTVNGETIKAIGDNGEKLYRYFEIAADGGMYDGVQHIVPLATDVGQNTFNGTMQQVTQEIIEHPATYTVFKNISRTGTFVRGVDTAGIGFAPVAARRGLGEAVARPTESAPEAEPESTSEQTPESTEPAPEPELTESERAAWENEITQRIVEGRDIIDGENGIKILSEDASITPENQDRWSNWWNNLSEDGKNFVRNIVNEIESSQYKNQLSWGSGFRSWFNLDPNR